MNTRPAMRCSAMRERRKKRRKERTAFEGRSDRAMFVIDVKVGVRTAPGPLDVSDAGKVQLLGRRRLLNRVGMQGGEGRSVNFEHSADPGDDQRWSDVVRDFVQISKQHGRSYRFMWVPGCVLCAVCHCNTRRCSRSDIVNIFVSSRASRMHMFLMSWTRRGTCLRAGLNAANVEECLSCVPGVKLSNVPGSWHVMSELFHVARYG